jgi:murein DD-endopeptidase MepM/ murein hydrolase activator NlpD
VSSFDVPKVRGRVKKKKFFTILMIPNDENKMTKWRIPGLIIPCLLVFSLIGLATVVYFVYGYFTFQNEAKSLRSLQGINLRQAQEIRNLQARTRSLEAKIKSLDELDLKVREMVGLEPAPEAPDRETEETGTTVGSSLSSSAYLEQRMTAKGVSRSREIPRAEIDSLLLAQNVGDSLERLHEQADQKVMQMEQLMVEVEERLDYLESLPDLWPLVGRITSTYGWRKNPVTKRGNEFHAAIDIAGRVGSPVKAAGKGKVIFAGYRSGWGRVVVIDHGYGYQTQYAHNSSLLVKNGQTVQKGQVIARVGNTGRSTGPHLDFRIFKNGQPIDPLTVLKSR